MSIPWGRIPVRLTHLSSKGQLTIPRRFIRALGLKPGDAITFKPVRGGLALVPLRNSKEAPVL